MDDAQTTAEHGLFLGVTWNDHVPYMRTRNGGQRESELVAVEGLSLRYRIQGEPERVCLGHVPFRSARSFHDCHKKPQPGSRRCERCSIVEATFAANLHHAHTKGSAELDASVRDHMDQPNRLYLAAFRDGSIKVGTSTLGRADKRLEEQGAWIAQFVAETTNGRSVRHLEDAVTEQLAIAQSVSATRKGRGLISPVTDDQLLTSLRQAAADVHRLVVEPATGNDVELMDNPWRHPMTGHPALANPLRYPLSLTQGRHDLHALTAVGRHLLVKRADGDDVFAIDPAPLFGVCFEIGDFGSDEIAIQDSLF